MRLAIRRAVGTITHLRGFLVEVDRRISTSKAPHVLTVEPIVRSSPAEDPAQPASPICNLLKNGGKWDDLTSSFGTFALSQPLVNGVLLNLKEPDNAKKALLFFHWASTYKKFRHDLSSYSFAASILVRAGHIADAVTLIESSVTKFSDPGSYSSSHVVDAFLCAYNAILPGLRLLDLLVQAFAKLKLVEMGFDACNRLTDGGFSLNLKTFNALLSASSKTDRSDLAWKVFEYMIRRRAYPNKETIEILIGVMCKDGLLGRMMDLLDTIHGRRCGPGVIVSATLVYRMLEEERVDEGVLLLKRMLQKDLIFDTTFYSLNVFARCASGELELAHEVHEEMLNKGCGANAFAYTAMIGAHCKKGTIDEAIRLFHEMQLGGLKPYKETYSLVMEGCAKAGRVDESLAFHDAMTALGFLPDCSAFNELVDRLCEDGEAERANEVLTTLMGKGFKPNEATYSKLMDGFGKIMKAQEIVKLYYEMQHDGPNPGLMTYVSLVRNLRMCNKLKDAEKFFGVMKDKGLVPSDCAAIDALL